MISELQCAHLLARYTTPPARRAAWWRRSAGGPLSSADRASLELAASSRVNQAFTDFTTAVSRQLASMKAKEKRDAEILAAFIDIFFGLNAPIFSSWVMLGEGRLKKVADKLTGMLTAKAGEKTVKLIAEGDLLKESFKGVGKLGATVVVKLNPDILFGEKDVDAFAAELRRHFRAGIQAITDKIAFHQLSDEQLIATFLAYDEEFANEDAYVKALKQLFADFERFVRPVGVIEENPSAGGVGWPAHGIVDHPGAAWMDGGPTGRWLVLVREESMVPDRYMSVEVVPPSIVPFAIEATMKKFGKVETIRTPWVPAKPDPDSETEMIRRFVEQNQAAQKRLDAEAEAALKRAAEQRRKEAADFVKAHPEWQVH